jgi:hypothetical protein
MKLAAGSLLSPTKTPGTQRKSLTNKILSALSVLVGNHIQSPSWETHKKSPTICGASLYVSYHH